MRLSMRHMVLVTPAFIGSYTITGCSDRTAIDTGPTVEVNQPIEAGKKGPVSGLDAFEKRIADKQARDKAKAGSEK